MNCCITDLRMKEVINLCDGHRLGTVSDVEIDTCTGTVISIVIWSKCKCCGIFGKNDDIKIPWHNIKVIGNDTILVEYHFPPECECDKNCNIWDNILHRR